VVNKCSVSELFLLDIGVFAHRNIHYFPAEVGLPVTFCRHELVLVPNEHHHFSPSHIFVATGEAMNIPEAILANIPSGLRNDIQPFRKQPLSDASYNIIGKRLHESKDCRGHFLLRLKQSQPRIAHILENRRWLTSTACSPHRVKNNVCFTSLWKIPKQFPHGTPSFHKAISEFNQNVLFECYHITT